MLSITECRKILGDKAKNLSDENIEAIRDALYLQANLVFNNWQKSCLPAKRDFSKSPSASEKLASTPPLLRCRDRLDVNKVGVTADESGDSSRNDEH